MTQCKKCLKELTEEKFGKSYHTLVDGTKKAYKDSTCMVCRRKKHLEKPEKKEIHKEGSRNWYKNNPDKVKEQRLRKYGITLEEYNMRREQQKYCCMVCKRNEREVEQGRAIANTTALQVDHCHVTQTIRGLLCTNCNTMLGKVKDDVSILEAAIVYLKRNITTGKQAL